jgi:Mn2+/Fe2+ NRAMP family transporter
MQPMWITALLLVVFLVNLVGFAYLGVRRRQGYYAALVVTFALLTAAMAARLVSPEAEVASGLALAEALRMAAWPAAAVSIGWTLFRIGQRRRRSGAE